MHLLLIAATLVATAIVVESSNYCDFTSWSRWSACSKTCGRGMRYRSRSCIKEDYCTCYGSTRESEKCYGGQAEWRKKGGCVDCKQRYVCKWKTRCKGKGKRDCGRKPSDKCGYCDCNCYWYYSDNQYDGRCYNDGDRCVIKKKRYCKCTHDYCPEKCDENEKYQVTDCPYRPGHGHYGCRSHCRCYYTDWVTYGDCYKSGYKCVINKRRVCKCNYPHCPRDCHGDSSGTTDCPDPRECCRCYWKPKNEYGECYRRNYRCYRKHYYRYCYCPPGYPRCDCEGTDYKEVNCDHDYCK